MTEPIVYVYSSNDPPSDKESLKLFMRNLVSDAINDFNVTNAHTLGKGAKFVAGTFASSYFAKETGTLTPIAWATRRFGPLPLEFTKSGSLQIFSLTIAQRLGAMAIAAAAKFALVTIAYEGGVFVGSVTNQFLSEEFKTDIGGTMYGIICEEGWKDLWRHPFGYGVNFGPKGERLINY